MTDFVGVDVRHNRLRQSITQITGPISYLAGSGISVASGLPSGMMFNGVLAASLRVKRVPQEIFDSLFITSHPRSQGLRFEQLIGVLREMVDPNLTILDVFDQPAEPSAVHYYLARAIHDGCPVFTPNFDSLIERAFEKMYGAATALPLACIEESARGFRGFSFEEHRRRHSTTGLYKLHGTLHIQSVSRLRGKTIIPARRTIGSTLDTIGRSSSIYRLESNKYQVFTRAIASTILLVAGYSGLDEFDIIPSLADNVAKLRALYWINHQTGLLPCIAPQSDAIPSAIREAAALAGVPLVTIVGDTTLIFKLMFSSANIPPQSHNLASTPIAIPNLALTTAEKLSVTARAVEVAGKQEAAQKVYAQAARAYKKLGNQNLYGAMIRRRARLLNVLGSTALAEKLCSRALAIHTHENTRDKLVRHEIAADLILSAILLRDHGKLPEALQRVRRARRLYVSINERGGYVRSLMEEATLLSTMGKPASAIPIARAALKFCEKDHRREDAAQNAVKLAALYRLNGRVRKALELARKAIQLNELLGHLPRLAQAKSSEAHCQLMLGNTEEAVRLYREAIVVFDAVGRRESAEIARSNVAIARMAQGRCNEALELLKRGRVVFKRRWPLRAASSCDDIALCLYQMGKLKEALRWFYRGSLARPGKSGDSLAARLNTEGILLGANGEFQLAVQANQRGLTLCRRQGLNLELVRGLYIKAVLQQKCGADQPSRKTLMEALQRAKRYQFGLIAGLIEETLGTWYVDHQQHKHAITHFVSALSYYKQNRNSGKVKIISQHIKVARATHASSLQ